MSGGEETLEETRRLERREFERGHLSEGEQPVEPRPAATMVLARPRRRSFEVLLLRRPDSSRFAAGAYVFSGGVVDPEDEDPRVAERLGVGVPGGEPRWLVAAIREQFEETGILLARGGPAGEEVREARLELAAGVTRFPEIVERLDLDFRDLPVAYFARWITPARLARRYDARFFLAEHPGGEPELGEEHTGAVWLTAREALERFDRGELPMLFPTRKTLEGLEPYRRLEDALAAFRARPVEAVRPRLLVDEEGVTPVLPDDPRYGEAGLEPGEEA